MSALQETNICAYSKCAYSPHVRRTPINSVGIFMRSCKFWFFCKARFDGVELVLSYEVRRLTADLSARLLALVRESVTARDMEFRWIFYRLASPSHINVCLKVWMYSVTGLFILHRLGRKQMERRAR